MLLNTCIYADSQTLVFADKQTKDQLTGKTSLQIFGARKKSLRFYDINLIVIKKECRKKSRLNHLYMIACQIEQRFDIVLFMII